MKRNTIQDFLIPIAKWLFGEFDNGIRILILLIITNCILGIISHRKIDKRKSYSVIPKKASILLVVILANLIDSHLTSGSLLRTLSLWFYIVNESLFLLQHLSALGIDVPEKLINILTQFKGKNKKEKNQAKKPSKKEDK